MAISTMSKFVALLVALFFSSSWALPPSSPSDRRVFLATSAGGTIWTLVGSSEANVASADPFVVVGANGKTGSQCVQYCANNKLNVRATARSGAYADLNLLGSSAQGFVENITCDVTKPDLIAPAVRGARAVIFAASQSKAGGSAAQVDNAGLVNVAKACLEAKVPHFVIVSSGSVSKPDSSVYKFLNLFGSIMDEKAKGEEAVRQLYQADSSSSCTYTIIRPGGLTTDSAIGVSQLALNQGDTVSGRIARADVASLCVQAAMYSKLTGDTTFECYNANTAKPLESVGMSNILGQTNDSAAASDKERRGDSFEQIFTGLEKD